MARFEGTERLKTLLAEAGSDLDVEAVTELVRGVAAGPARPGWERLVASEPHEPLDRQLGLLLAEVRDASDDGLGKRPPEHRLGALRGELERRGLQGFVIPRADEHQGEYVPPRASRLQWLTGFSGSAGQAVVLMDRAAIFVDGRYTLQVERETDLNVFSRQHLIAEPPPAWIAANLPEGARLGYDPWLHTPKQVRALKRACEDAGGELVACEGNPLDAVWDAQPPAPIAPVRVHDESLAGRSSADKRRELGEGLAEIGAEAAVLSLPDSICWLLNVRGGDLPYNPLVLSFAILRADGGATWFVDGRKLTPAVREHLGGDVEVAGLDALGTALDALAGKGAKVLVDPASAPQWVVDRLDGARVVERPDPCLLPKAKKNAVELEGMREAHRRDGAAVSRFLAWVDREAPGGELDELTAESRLEAFRRETGELLDLSFNSISGAGPNGAVVHYRASAETNRKLGDGELYLIDSGGQYADGTTDITRTVPIGTPSAEMRDRFTRVLKGHIAIATARFPKGTTGAHLDALARKPLWDAGVDYDHGTGHGVGAYLCVHEGPHRISKAVNTVPLEPGMIVSNEPGYYKTGAYGIRIENLVTVTEVDVPGGERDMLGFETLTLAPIDRRLVDLSLLDDAELAWLNDYHVQVRETLSPRVDAETRTWLDTATAPITRG